MDNLDKNYNAILENTDLEEIRARLDGTLAEAGWIVGYGRANGRKAGTNYFAQHTSKKNVDWHGAFSYVYTDTEQGDVVAIIGAERFQRDKITMRAIWNSEAANDYVSLVLISVSQTYNLPLPDSMKITEEAKTSVEQTQEPKSVSKIAPFTDANADMWEILTEREREIAMLYAQGMNEEKISKQLVISRRTVRVHRQNLASKLEISSDEKTVVTHLSRLLA